MRDLFPGYYQTTEADFRKLWQSCVFSVDANVLLDVFRYSEETSIALRNLSTTLRQLLADFSELPPVS